MLKYIVNRMLGQGGWQLLFIWFYTSFENYHQHRVRFFLILYYKNKNDQRCLKDFTLIGCLVGGDSCLDLFLLFCFDFDLEYSLWVFLLFFFKFFLSFFVESSFIVIYSSIILIFLTLWTSVCLLLSLVLSVLMLFLFFSFYFEIDWFFAFPSFVLLLLPNWFNFFSDLWVFIVFLISSVSLWQEVSFWTIVYLLWAIVLIKVFFLSLLTDFFFFFTIFRLFKLRKWFFFPSYFFKRDYVESFRGLKFLLSSGYNADFFIYCDTVM